jgi:hypothetical protein
MDMGDLQTCWMHAQIFPNIWAKAFCLLYDLLCHVQYFGFIITSSILSAFQLAPKNRDSRNTSRKFMCQGQQNSQNKHVWSCLPILGDIYVWYLFGACLVYLWNMFDVHCPKISEASLLCGALPTVASLGRSAYVRTHVDAWMDVCMYAGMYGCM